MIKRYDSPASVLWLGVADGCVTLCDWVEPEVSGDSTPADKALMDRLTSQLDEYFAGCRRDFDLPLRQRATPFRQRVWQALSTVTYGTTMTYGQLAAKIGTPQAVRAVATALGCNRLSILLPCHRIVAATSIGGYRGGLDAKHTLLAIERL